MFVRLWRDPNGVLVIVLVIVVIVVVVVVPTGTSGASISSRMAVSVLSTLMLLSLLSRSHSLRNSMLGSGGVGMLGGIVEGGLMDLSKMMLSLDSEVFNGGI